jgi:Smg protein
MKKEGVLNVLMYLFNTHLQQGVAIELTSDDLLLELEEAGFRERVIHRALQWLSSLADMRKEPLVELGLSSLRVFSEEERHYLGIECQTFLVELVRQEIIAWSTFELVIYFSMELESEGIDVSLLKWVTLMVLYNMPDEQDALKRMELLVLEDSAVGSLH